MLIFWFVIALMIMLALAFLVVPLLRQHKQTETPRDLYTITLYKQRLKELEHELAQGMIDKGNFHYSKKALQKKLLMDLPESSTEYSDKPSSKKLTIATLFAFIIFLPILSLGLYFKWGDSQQLANYLIYQKDKATIQKEMTQFKNPQQIIIKMKQILVEHSDSARGWFLLGRLYMGQAEYQLASAAFAQSNKLKPNQTGIMLQYAEALFFLHDKRLNKTAQELINKVQQIQPQNPVAMNLLALSAYNEKDYQTAIQLWEKLLPHFSPMSHDSLALKQAIALAQKKVGQPSTN